MKPVTKFLSGVFPCKPIWFSLPYLTSLPVDFQNTFEFLLLSAPAVVGTISRLYEKSHGYYL